MVRWILALFLLLGLSTRADAGKVVLVTHDGLSTTGRPYGCSFFSNVHAEDGGITLPGHQALTCGAGPTVDRCTNNDGRGLYPYVYELVAERGGRAVLVSGASYLLFWNRYSLYFGPTYQPETILATTFPGDWKTIAPHPYEQWSAAEMAMFAADATAHVISTAPPGFPDSCSALPLPIEGSDSLIMAAAIAYLDTADVDFALINLKFGDYWKHHGEACTDSASYLAWIDSIRVEQRRLVDEVLIPFLDPHPNYAGRTTLVETVDHDFHDETGGPRNKHGHGWLPDSTDCAPLCSGCEMVTASFRGPGIRTDFESADSISHYDIAATLAYLLEVSDPYPEGRVLSEIFEAPVGVRVSPASSSLSASRSSLFDVSGRRVAQCDEPPCDFRTVPQGIYLERVTPHAGRPFTVKKLLLR